jgi:DNA-binding IscR family transcriptional regulator
MTTKTDTTPAVANTDVLAEVAKYVDENKRPCPTKHLTKEFGDAVLDTLDELKKGGVLLGLRGRNGGFALPGSDIVAKRSEHAAKKAAKAAEKAADEGEADEAAVG